MRIGRDFGHSSKVLNRYQTDLIKYYDADIRSAISQYKNFIELSAGS